MQQRMTKITLIGIALCSIFAVVGMILPGYTKYIGWATAAIAGIVSIHNVSRGFEDGLTKFKAVAFNGKDKKK